MADLLGNLGSSISDILGAKTNAGLNYQPTFQGINEPVDPSQAGQAYNTSQDALARQLAFVNALNPQSAIQQQQSLANQYQQQALGQGPNPALAQLQQTTGQNVAAQNALMAGQRGTGANAGLLARQAAMQGSQIQQNAIGQGASLAAQQQLAAQQGLANLSQGQIGNAQQGIGLYNQAAQSQQQLLLNAIAQANQQKVAMQSNMNNVSGGLANTVANGQGNVLTGIGQGLGGIGSQIVGGLFKGAPSNQGGGGGGGGGASASDIANANGQNQSDAAFGAKGGQVRKYDDGGVVSDPTSSSSGLGPESFVGKYLKGWSGSNVNAAANPQAAMANYSNGPFGGGSFSGNNIYGPKNSIGSSIAGAVGPHLNELINGPTGSGTGFGSQTIDNTIGPADVSGGPFPTVSVPVTSGPTDPGNDPVPAGGFYIAPGDFPGSGGAGGTGGGFSFGAGAYGAKGGVIKGEKYANQMKPVPGKAKIKGDSLKNDNVKAMLSPGEIIIPRSIATHKNAPEMARHFVAAVLAKNGLSGRKK